MTKLNGCLALILVFCALSVVLSQHEARKLITALENERVIAHQLEVEWGKLQLEQSTLATHRHIEGIAREDLNMEMPVETRLHAVMPTYFVGLANSKSELMP